jgi:prevent-host-death family protein
MSAVSIREFSYNPSAMFARVEQGETIEVTRHGRVIAVLLPGGEAVARYVPLVTKGLVKLKGTTTSDLDRIVRVPVPDDVSPLDMLLTERVDDDR